MKKILKFLIIFMSILPFIFFLHTGFGTDSLIKNLQAIIFSTIFAFVIVWPIFKKYIFILSAVLLLGMTAFSIFNIMDWADILGSSGVGLVLLLLLSYLPQVIKKGYVENL